MASSSVEITPPSQPDFRKMNKQALRDALASRGLDTNGLRPSLIQRLESSVKALAATEVPSATEALSANETLKSDTETPQTETPENAPQIGTQTDLDVSAGQAQGGEHQDTHKDTSESQENTKTHMNDGEASTLEADTKASPLKSSAGRVKVSPPSTVENGKSEHKSSNATHLSDLDRKRIRAERFGVGLQVSEKEKLAIRAERFAGAEGKKSSSIREPESEKRKQRAARFGIVEDESKKKARQDRFAPASEQDKSVEVDKKKARAARFGAAAEPAD